MIEVLMLGAVGFVAVVGLGIQGIFHYSRAEKARLEAVFEQNPGWSREPLHVPERQILNRRHLWSAYGKNDQGVVWELHLDSREDEPDQLVFRTPNLKLERLELMLVPQGEMSRLMDILLQLDGVLNSFLAKMAIQMANKFTSRLGIDLEDLRSFMKSAEQHPMGQHTLLTRGQLPLKEMFTPTAEAMIQKLQAHKLGLRWGSSGLTLEVDCSRRQLERLAPRLLQLGSVLVQGSGYTG